MARKPYANEDVDAATKKIQAEVAKAMERLFAELKAQLSDLERDEGNLARTYDNARALNNILDGLEETMRRVGFDDISERQIALMRELSDDVLREAKRLGFDKGFDAVTKEDITTLLNGNLRAIEALEREGAQGLERLLAKSLTGRLGWNDISDKMMQELNRLDDKTSLQLSASIAGFHTQVRTEYFSQEGEDGEPLVTWWLYDGPSDERNRNFCAHFVGTRITLEDLDEHADEFDRDFTAPPSVSLGGYNCRHQLIPLVDPEVIKSYPRGPKP